MKKVVLLTQDEPIFGSIIVEELIKGLGNEIVAVGLFPPLSSARSAVKEAARRLRYYGATDFLRLCCLFVAKKAGGRSVAMLKQAGIPLLDWGDASLSSPKLLAELNRFQPDVILILSNQIVRDPLLSYPKDGCFNIHAALLPRHRGREPIFYSLLAGDPELGVTVHKMVSQLDAGEIGMQATFEADINRPLFEWAEMLWREGAKMFCKMIRAMEANGHAFRKQDESKASYHGFPNAADVRRFRRRGGRFF